MSTNTVDNSRKVTTRRLTEMKHRGEKISMLTAYDFSSARIIDEAGMDVILVGDSASNVMAGNTTTLPITLDQMIYHAKSVMKGVKRALVVVDLPFVISPPNAPSMKEIKKGRNIIANRFAAFYPSDELYQTYSFFIKEAFRVLKPNGLLVWKCQMTVSGGINHSIPYYSVMCGQKVGFTLEDEFILTARTRLISGKVKTQKHARKYHSNFLVFKKHTSKKYNKCNLFNYLEKYV